MGIIANQMALDAILKPMRRIKDRKNAKEQENFFETPKEEQIPPSGS